jgi:hypothetical protein
VSPLTLLTRHESPVNDLAARIDQIASDLAARAGRDPKGPPATCWPALDADARTAALAVLTEWVAVMRQWHPCYFEPVAECWASHPEVVIELHNVMTEFTRIYRRQHPRSPTPCSCTTAGSPEYSAAAAKS